MLIQIFTILYVELLVPSLNSCHYYKFRGGNPGIVCSLKQCPNKQAEFRPGQNQGSLLERCYITINTAGIAIQLLTHSESQLKSYRKPSVCIICSTLRYRDVKAYKVRPPEFQADSLINQLVSVLSSHFSLPGILNLLSECPCTMDFNLLHCCRMIPPQLFLLKPLLSHDSTDKKKPLQAKIFSMPLLNNFLKFSFNIHISH